MKTKEQPFKKHYPPVKIYKKDIEEIFNCMQEVSGNIKIESGRFEFDNLDDLFNNKRYVEANRLYLFIEKPEFSLRFEPDRIWLTSENSKAVSVGAEDKIKCILIKRKNRALWLITGEFSNTIFRIWTILGFLLIFPLTLNAVIFGMVVIFLCIVVYYYVRKLRFNVYSQILLVDKDSDNLSFIHRNRDNIIVTVVGSSIFTLISIVIGHCWK